MRGIIETQFYRPASADRQRLLHGAARGLVQALGDPNSVYEPPAEREVGDSRWTGRYEGVGMYVDHRDGQMIVTAPIEGGPAELAGVRPGDIVLEVDGRSIVGMSLTEQVLIVRGPKGTTVTLTVRREGAPEPLRIPIVRDEIHLISARGRLLDNGLGLLRISQFTEGTPGEARVALDSLISAQPPGLLLDLRGNGGGLLEPAVQVGGMFLGGGPVVLEVHANGQQKPYVAPDGPPATELPMLVLIDRGTASASEVLAAALRDRGRADLVGERTYGKNTVQYIHRLSEGSGLRITVAEWHTPSGRLLPATGLEPDLPAAAPNPPEPNRDSVLEAAGQLLLSRIARGGQ
jgi:carboxyl-terminal processing protease